MILSAIILAASLFSESLRILPADVRTTLAREPLDVTVPVVESNVTFARISFMFNPFVSSDVVKYTLCPSPANAVIFLLAVRFIAESASPISPFPADKTIFSPVIDEFVFSLRMAFSE